MTYTDTCPDDDCPECGWGQSYCTCAPIPMRERTIGDEGWIGATFEEEA